MGALLYSDDLADQPRDVGDRAAQLPRPDVQERLMLCVAGLVIHKQCHLPVALEHVPWDVSGHRDSAPRIHRCRLRPLVDVLGHDGITSPSPSGSSPTQQGHRMLHVQTSSNVPSSEYAISNSSYYQDGAFVDANLLRRCTTSFWVNRHSAPDSMWIGRWRAVNSSQDDRLSGIGVQ